MTMTELSPFPPKSLPRDFSGRFREIISDPLNLLIRRVPFAGTVEDGLVTLHNGHRVAVSGEGSYYNNFSQVLIFNRGVHEPLEEFAFQQMLPTLRAAPVMIELGAYWAHYSMWLKQARPAARCIMIEPDAKGIDAGRKNFARNGYEGTFEQGMIGKEHLTVDGLLDRYGIARLDVLHSDIQGYEIDMLAGAEGSLAANRIDHVLVSTHSEGGHNFVVRQLKRHGYRIEVESGHDTHTTSFDGFVLAVLPDLPRFLPDMQFLGRTDISQASPEILAKYVADIAAFMPRP
jgi:hypothetical protein